MDLYQLIEAKRFLGREFLIWLWFESEVFEGEIESSSHGLLEVHLEKQITLESGLKEKEQSRLKGTQPSHTPEAREAIRQGKTPTQAKVRITRGEQEFLFVLQSDTLAMSGVKIPALLKGEEDDPVFERLGLMEDLEAMVEGLFVDFLALRVSNNWSKVFLPTMLRWSREQKVTELDAYSRQRTKALEHAHRHDTKRLKSAAELLFAGHRQ